MIRRVSVYRERVEGEEHRYELEYNYTPIRPARIYGPAECCHPEEGGAEVEGWYLDGQPISERDVPASVQNELISNAYEYEAGELERCEEERAERRHENRIMRLREGWL